MAHDRTQTPRPVDRPEPGHYAARLTKGGPLLGFRIIENGGLWCLICNGVVIGKVVTDPWRCHPLMESVAFSRRITEAEYLRLIDAAAQAAPGDPLTEPGAPVDLASAPPLYRRKETP